MTMRAWVDSSCNPVKIRRKDASMLCLLVLVLLGFNGLYGYDWKSDASEDEVAKKRERCLLRLAHPSFSIVWRESQRQFG